MMGKTIRRERRSTGSSGSTSTGCARERLDRAQGRCSRSSELGSLLCFDMVNIRYMTATHIGTWAMDKLVRFSLLARRTPSRSCGTSARRRRAPPARTAPWLDGDQRSRAAGHLDAARRHVAREPAAPRTWRDKI